MEIKRGKCETYIYELFPYKIVQYLFKLQMPRNFVGKKTKPTEYLLQNALKEVLSGKLSIRKAAEVFGLKRSTVGFYSKRHSSCGLLPPKKVKRPQHPS